MPVIAQLRDRTWQLESLAVMARKVVLGDEPAKLSWMTSTV